MHKLKILVLFYSMYGHIFEMAKAVVRGVKKEGGKPILMQVEEMIPEKYWDTLFRHAKESARVIQVAAAFKFKGLAKKRMRAWQGYRKERTWHVSCISIGIIDTHTGGWHDNRRNNDECGGICPSRRSRG